MMLSESQRVAAQEFGSGPDSGPGPAGPAGMNCCCPAGQQQRLRLGQPHSAQVGRRVQAALAEQREQDQDDWPGPAGEPAVKGKDTTLVLLCYIIILEDTESFRDILRYWNIYLADMLFLK